MPIDRRITRARAATMVAFFTNGAMASSLMARYAEVKQALDLNDLVFGFVVVSLTFGGALAAGLPAIVVRRLGTQATSRFGTLALGVLLMTTAIAVPLGQIWLVILALIATGMVDACVDVAQNSQALRVQERMGRSIITLMHAGWSLGAAVGALVATGLASLEVPLVAHIIGWSALCCLAVLLATRAYLPDRLDPVPVDTADAAGDGPPRPAASRTRVAVLVAPLALIALSGITVEDIANNWSAVFLHTERGVALGQAGIGLTVIIGAQFVGRFFGDRLIDALGTRLALQIGLAAVVIGLCIGAWMPSTVVTLVGFGLAGFGSAVTVPVAFTEADALPGLRAQTGVTLVSWAMRTATLALSPAIGAISTGTSLPIAFTVIAAIALAGLIATRSLHRARPVATPSTTMDS